MNAKTWLQQQLLPLLKDNVNELEKYGFPDETLDVIEQIIVLLKRNSKPFRKTISYFAQEGATTPTVAVNEICATTKTIRKTLNDLYEVGACDRQPLRVFHTDLKRSQTKAQVFFLDKGFVPLFLEKHYNVSINKNERPVYFCKVCGFAKHEYQPGEVCMSCYQKTGKIVPLEMKV